MKYVLVIGLKYKKYKKPANVTISIADKLIDTFQLDDDYTETHKILEHIDTDLLKNLNKAHWYQKDESKSRWLDQPKFYKTYIIDEKNLKDFLELNVDNSNSDFNNGFMKNSSMIMFPIIGLFPMEAVRESNRKLMEILIKFGHAVSLGQDVEPSSDRVQKKQRTRWPAINSFYVEHRNELYQKNGVVHPTMWIGGSFTAKIPIRHKHKIKYLGSSHDKTDIGFFATDSVESLLLAGCKTLINTYNEDK